MSDDKKSKKSNNPTGHRNPQTKTRNAARREFRAAHPEVRGKQLKRWPLDGIA